MRDQDAFKLDHKVKVRFQDFQARSQSQNGVTMPAAYIQHSCLEFFTIVCRRRYVTFLIYQIPFISFRHLTPGHPFSP